MVLKNFARIVIIMVYKIMRRYKMRAIKNMNLSKRDTLKSLFILGVSPSLLLKMQYNQSLDYSFESENILDNEPYYVSSHKGRIEICHLLQEEIEEYLRKG